MTVRSSVSMEADALATTLLLLGVEEGLLLLERAYPEVEVLFILEDGSHVMTAGFDVTPTP